MCCCTMLQNLDMPFDALLSTTVGCGMTKAILWWHNCTTLQNHSQPSYRLKDALLYAATWYLSNTIHILQYMLMGNKH